MWGLIRCQPMPDEPALGHLGRIAVLHGFRSAANFKAKLLKSSVTAPHLAQVVLRDLLCDSAGLSPEDYSALHSMNPFIRNVDHENGVPVASLGAQLFRQPVRPKRANSGVRFCSRCVDLDLQQHGFSWVRRSHDLPGLDWRIIHDIALDEIQSMLPFDACPHVWQERELLRHRPVERARLSIAPAFLGRYVAALLAISRNPQSLRAEHLHAELRERIYIAVDSDKGSASRLLICLKEAAPKVWLDSIRL